MAIIDQRESAGAPPLARPPAKSKQPLTPEAWARKQAKEEREFWGHLGTYGAIITFLFAIDLLTGGDWWFFWPMLGWGVAVAIHAVSVFGGNRLGPDWEARKARELLERATGESAPVRPVDTTPASLRKLIDQGIADVARLRSNALRMTEPEVRAQGLRICTRADDILAVLAEPGRDQLLAREFVDQVLTPARTVFANYVRLSERRIASAEPALRRVETHDLPYIEQTLNDLHERLHRDDVISLEVASEMLTLGRAIELDDEAGIRERQ